MPLSSPYPEIERTKRKPPADLDSYDWYLRGAALHSAAQYQSALSCFRTAIEKDANLWVTEIDYKKQMPEVAQLLLKNGNTNR